MLPLGYVTTHRSNVEVTHGGRVHDDIGDTEKIPSTDPRQVGSVEQSFTQLELLYSEVDVVPIGKLVGTSGDAAALLNSIRGRERERERETTQRCSKFSQSGSSPCLLAYSYSKEVGDTCATVD